MLRASRTLLRGFLTTIIFYCAMGPCEIKKIKKWGHCTPKCHVFDRSKKLFFLPYKVVKKRKLHLTPDRFKRSQKSGTRPDRSRGQFLIQTCGNLGVFSLLMEKGCLDCFTIDIQ